MRLLALAFLLLVPIVAHSGCIIDDTGEEICIEGAPERVVSLYGAFTESLWELGAGETLIARTKNDDTIPEVTKLPVVGSGLRPNVEYLLALRPDLIVARGSKAGRVALKSLRERGLVVAGFNPTDLEGLYSAIDRLSVLLDKPDEGHSLVERLKGRIEAVKKKTSGEEKKPSVAFEVRAEPLTLAGRSSVIQEVIAAAGGTNVVRQDKKLVRFDVELLLKLDPDHYVVQTGPMNRNPGYPAERPHHRELKAVKEGRVIVVDEKKFSRPGPKLPQAVEELSRILHPSLWE